MSNGLLLCCSGMVVGNLFQNKALPSFAHAGLVFDRFLKIWDGMPDSPDRKDLYLPLKEFADAFNERGKSNQFQDQFQDLLKQIYDHMEIASASLSMGKAIYSVQWRLACGLGNGHPTENGFSFDSIVGVPVLVGSSIKGLCRATAKIEGIDESEIIRLFGPEKTGAGQESSTGELCFYDAYPSKWPTLCVDIVNCHHSDYYTPNNKAKRTPPLETESPNPVFFLAVDKGSQFVFRISSRKKSIQDLEMAFEILGTSLTIFGMGSKTAVGYGVFSENV